MQTKAQAISMTRKDMFVLWLCHVVCRLTGCIGS